MVPIYVGIIFPQAWRGSLCAVSSLVYTHLQDETIFDILDKVNIKKIKKSKYLIANTVIFLDIFIRFLLILWLLIWIFPVWNWHISNFARFRDSGPSFTTKCSWSWSMEDNEKQQLFQGNDLKFIKTFFNPWLDIHNLFTLNRPVLTSTFMDGWSNGFSIFFQLFILLETEGWQLVTTHYFKQLLYFREKGGNSDLWAIHSWKCTHIHLCSEVSKTKQETD